MLERPNDILAVEYCKAILARGSGLIPLPICRPGDYHALDADRGKPLRHGPPAADFGGGAVAGLRAGGGPPGL